MPANALICVVDDDDLVRRTMCNALEAAGFKTIEADNGTAGLKAIERVMPAVAIIDIVMPDREGHDVIVEATRRFPDLRILAVSGGGKAPPSERLELALQLGAHEYLAKPFSMRELVARVTKLSSRKES